MTIRLLDILIVSIVWRCTNKTCGVAWHKQMGWCRQIKKLVAPVPSLEKCLSGALCTRPSKVYREKKCSSRLWKQWTQSSSLGVAPCGALKALLSQPKINISHINRYQSLLKWVWWMTNVQQLSCLRTFSSEPVVWSGGLDSPFSTS